MMGSTVHSRSYAVCDSALDSGAATVDASEAEQPLPIPLSATWLMPLVGSAVLAGNKRFSTK